MGRQWSGASGGTCHKSGHHRSVHKQKKTSIPSTKRPKIVPAPSAGSVKAQEEATGFMGLLNKSRALWREEAKRSQLALVAAAPSTASKPRPREEAETVTGATCRMGHSLKA